MPKKTGIMATLAFQQRQQVSKQGLWWKILISIVVLTTVAVVCSRFPAEYGSGWYHQLKQPFFAPAYWMPFVLWTVVYILMGWTVGLLWQQNLKTTNPIDAIRAKNGLKLFGVHLIFNLSCPIILIGFQMPVLAFIDMLILLALIGVMIYRFSRFNRLASRLMIPYLIWIVYAAALNLAIIVLN